MVTAILVIIAFTLGFEISDRIQQKILRDSKKQFWERMKKADEEYRKRLNKLITD